MIEPPPTIVGVPLTGVSDDCFIGPWREVPDTTDMLRILCVIGEGKPVTIFAVKTPEGDIEEAERRTAAVVADAESRGFRVVTRREFSADCRARQNGQPSPADAA